MQIVEITARHVRIPLRKPLRHASHVRSDSDNVVVTCRLADGTTGYGEGVPRDYVTGETGDGAMALLQRSELPRQLATPPTAWPDVVRWIDNVRLASVPGDDRACQGNAARCAVELALLDAFGQLFQQPLFSVTELLASNLWRPRRRVQYSTAITSAKGFKARLAAWMMRLYGFNQCKIKVGIAGHNDVARLRDIRSGIGAAMDLRIDANEAWTPDTVVDRIRELEPFGITAVEQPVPHEQVQCLAEVRRQVKTSIMHDESLCSMVDAEAAVREQTCDLFNLRLSKCGGFIPSLRLAQFAKQRGLGYQLGCQVGETAILSAAGRHFATSVSDLRYLEGSYDRRLVRESLGVRDVTFGYGGWAPRLEGPGLGVAIDPAALERVTLRKEVLLVGT